MSNSIEKFNFTFLPVRVSVKRHDRVRGRDLV